VSGAQPFRIRDLTTHEDFVACVRLQEAVWGEGFDERVPTAILGIAARFGGVVAGAFREGEEELVGFVFGLTGLEQGVPVHWSDMLAVRRETRGRGLARALKLYQRDRLLRLGVTRMYWSFDPLEARNGHLNLNRLGVRVREYVEEMYGTSSSPLHQGIGTDRFVACWDMDSPRVQALLDPEREGRAQGQEGKARERGSPPGAAAGVAAGAGEALGVEMDDDGAPVPGKPRLHLSDTRILVAVPARIQGLKADRPETARRWRYATRETLTHYLARGWEVRALLREGEEPWARYLLIREG
jgi:predicted GNAT superfamily acetyltransferase